MPQHTPGDWILAQARHADAQGRRCYVQRGRHLQAESDERLDALWVAGMRSWAAVVHPRPLALDDAEAEMSLRDREPPQDLVGPELAAIINAMGQSLRAMPTEIVRGAIARAMTEASVAEERIAGRRQ